MSVNNLTIDGEYRYIVQWFHEWSELQRDDFVPILVKYITGFRINDNLDNDEVGATTPPINMNGLPNDFEFNGRPMSLFQCRIKLFNQWNRRWPAEFKEKLQQHISAIDGKVGEKIKCALKPNHFGNLTNGFATKEEHHSLKRVEVNTAKHAVEAGILNDPITEVLSNETSVDEIKAVENITDVEPQVANNTLYTDDNEVDTDDNKIYNNNARHKRTTDEHGEHVEQVEQMANLKINEENTETERDIEYNTVSMAQKQQQVSPSATVTVNPVVVNQTVTTNAEVPLVA